jgi:hypothetical protein
MTKNMVILYSKSGEKIHLPMEEIETVREITVLEIRTKYGDVHHVLKDERDHEDYEMLLGMASADNTKDKVRRWPWQR